jgi:hypothetical protein
MRTHKACQLEKVGRVTAINAAILLHLSRYMTD